MNELPDTDLSERNLQWVFRPPSWAADFSLSGPDIVTALQNGAGDLLIGIGAADGYLEALQIRPFRTLRGEDTPRYEISLLYHNAGSPIETLCLCMTEDADFEAVYPLGLALTWNGEAWRLEPLD